jgi:CDP-glycerol glycerophosphotransferase
MRPTPAPDVSVVVVVYNDPGRLPTAVRSVLDQTLGHAECLIVDDASTDNTFEVAQQLAAQHPGRVRAVRLPANTGSGGGPRNAGMVEARGRFVLFLDSDDVLDPHACMSLLDAAEEHGADITSGLCVRVHRDKKNRQTAWYPWLYTETRVLDSVAEMPDFFAYETLSTNKLYLREFLLEKNLRYPEGILYEDLQFVAEALLAAGKIVIIPNTVYYWHVQERTENKSVTNRRHEITNLLDRVEIHRRIDAMLAPYGAAELKVHKDAKFLKHDLVLHLRDLPHRSPEFREQFADAVVPYVQGFEPGAYDLAYPMHGVCSLLVQERDWDLLMPAVDSLMNKNTATAGLYRENDRIYWTDRYLDSAWNRRLLDVTGFGYQNTGLKQLRIGNRLKSFAVDGKGVRFAGEVANPLGVIPATAKLSATLEFRPRRKQLKSRLATKFPVANVAYDGDRITWDTVADVTGKLRPVGLVDVMWDVFLNLSVDGVVNTSRLTVTDTTDGPVSIPVRPLTTTLTADHLVAQTDVYGHLVFLLGQESAKAQRSQELLGKAIASPVGKVALNRAKAARKLQKKLVAPQTKGRAYKELLMRLPVRKGLVVFESHLGRQYSDNPKYIYEEMRRAGVKFEAVWSYAGSTAGFPKDAKLVKRGSWDYYRLLAQAEFWIDNQGFPRQALKRPETTYIQTWHGTALKRMGHDIPSEKRKSAVEREAVRGMLDRFDHFVVRTEHDVRTLVEAFELKADLLRVGYPRNDALVAPSAENTAEVAALRAQLGIPDGHRVLLYAPTFRQKGTAVQEFELPFDLVRFTAELGPDVTLLIRTHYLDKVKLPAGTAAQVRNVSGHPDITPLLLLADGLITDYSSVMFDYALLDRPLYFFTYDYDEYTGQERGAYFDLREEAPGPVVEDPESLFAALVAPDSYADRRAEFVRKYGEYDHGNAAKAIVQKFFPASGGKSV